MDIFVDFFLQFTFRKSDLDSVTIILVPPLDNRETSLLDRSVILLVGMTLYTEFPGTVLFLITHQLVNQYIQI